MFPFQQSSQRRNWIFETRQELDKIRKYHHDNACLKLTSEDIQVTIEDTERAVEFYLSRIRNFAKFFSFPLRVQVSWQLLLERHVYLW